MAISARRWISPSSLRRWAVASTDLAVVPPTRLIASDGKQILGNHTPAHVALKSRLSFVGGSPHGKGMLQGADGSFTAGPPTQRSPEPALLLLLGSLGGEAAARRQRHLLDSQSLCLLLVFGKKNPGRRWPSPALARSRLDVVAGPESRLWYRPDCPRELGSRSRCRFLPRQCAPVYQTRWAYALSLCE